MTICTYMIMMHILRFKDGVQHDCDGNAVSFLNSFQDL
jgi:hypothetical protein